MKRLLLLAVVLVLLCSPAMAYAVTFENVNLSAKSVAEVGVVSSLPATFAWNTLNNVTVENTSGGFTSAYSSTVLVINRYPQPSNYYAMSRLEDPYMSDATNTQTRFFGAMGGSATDTYTVACSPPFRYEIFISSDGTVTGYCNGIQQYTDTVVNYPQFIYVVNNVDDLIYGTNENRYIFGIPYYGKYFIKKDVSHITTDGLAFLNGTVTNPTSMTTSWGRSNISGQALTDNESIVFRNANTQTVYETHYTGTRTAGHEKWNLTSFINSSAPFGLYEITIPTSGRTSDHIVYSSTGATLTLGRDTYTNGDTAVATYNVEAAYRGLGAYRIDTMDVYGNVIDTQTVDGTLGTVDIPFSSADPIGVYYTALIVASGGVDTWLAYDYSELNGYVMFEGYVNNAETQAPIAAHINISQGSTIFDYDTVAGDGYQYNTTYPIATMFLAGSSITTNVTATGYRQYAYTFTPALAKTVALNFTLIPDSPTYDVGLAFGGVARETTYGRPIPLVLVAVMNSTHSEYYSTTGNSVGYYLCDYGASCHLTLDRNYQIWGSKTNYANSSIYNATAVGAI